MPSIIRRIGVPLAAVLTAVAIGAAAPPRADAHPATWRGCPYNAFCIYPRNTGWNHDHPQAILYFRGTIDSTSNNQWSHNMHNMYGIHRIYVNGAWYHPCSYAARGDAVYLNPGYDGNGLPKRQYNGGQSADVDFTPINSVTLMRGRFGMNC